MERQRDKDFLFRLFDFESRGVEIAESLLFLLRHREGGPSAWSQPIAIPPIMMVPIPDEEIE